MGNNNRFPAHIIALAEKAGGEPLAYSEKPTCITIVFVDGRKLIFDRTQTIDEPTPIVETEHVPSHPPAGVQTLHATSHPAKPRKGRKA